MEVKSEVQLNENELYDIRKVKVKQAIQEIKSGHYKPWYRQKKLMSGIISTITGMAIFLIFHAIGKPVAASDIIIVMTPILAFIGVEGVNDMRRR